MKRTANRAPNDLQAECAKSATAQTKILILDGVSLLRWKLSSVIPTSSIFQRGTVEEQDSAGTIDIMRNLNFRNQKLNLPQKQGMPKRI